MVDRSVATADEIMSAAVDELVRLRPAALSFFNHSANGRWSHVLKAWRAMLVVCLRRQADEVSSSRLRLATGRALRELLASEFDTIVDESPVAGIGEVTLVRVIGGDSWVVPKGTKFIRAGNPNAYPLPLQAAEYETTDMGIYPSGVLNKTIPIRALSTGPAPNVIQETGVTTNQLTLATPLPLTNLGAVVSNGWSVTRGTCAGGRSALTEDDLIRIGEVQPLGEIGPTRDAIIAGLLRDTGVRHYAAIDVPSVAGLRLFLADESWGTSGQFSTNAIQTLKGSTDSDAWLGFGGYVDFGLVENKFIRIEATVQLRDYRYLADTSEVSANIRATLSTFFNDRPDWYTWKLSTLRGRIARADRRILTCTSVVVKDRNDNILSEPGPIDPNLALIHYYLLADGFIPTYAGPV